MTNLQISIIYSSFMGSILNEYEKCPKPVMTLRKRIKKFMFKRARSNPIEFNEAIKYGDKIWREAIDYFAEQKIKIDSFALVVALWSSHAEVLEKFVNLSQAKMDKFCLLNDSELLDAELNAYEVAKYLNGKINENQKELF